MDHPLPLYSDRVLPLFPDDPLRLHPLPTIVDLLALRINWEHQTYSGAGFSAPRLRPLYARLRGPGGGSLPELIALTQLEFTGYEVIKQTPSADFGVILDVDRYYRYKLVLFDPTAGEARSPYMQVRPDGAGIVYAHALEQQHMTWYQRNAETWYLNQGLLVIGLNAAGVGTPFLKTIYPNLELPEYGYLADYSPPLPESRAIPPLITAPEPLPSGDWTIELAHGIAPYNGGAQMQHHFDGIVRMSVEVLTGVDRPLIDLTSGVLDTRFQHVLIRERGDGSIAPATYEWTLPLDFGGD